MSKRGRINKTINKEIIIIISTIIVFIFSFIIVNNLEHYYTIEGKIIETNDNTNIVTIEDITGNIWEIEDTNYNTNDNVKIKFFNNLTDSNRLDDIIKEVVIINE